MESILFDSKNSLTYKFGLHILEYVPKDMDLSIIDIGSGSGALTKELTHHGGTVIGIDKSVSAIKHATEKYPTVPFYVMDALRLQYENRFDIAFSNATFQEIEDKQKLFASIFKSLKRGGRLIAEFPSKNSNRQYFDMLREELEAKGIDVKSAMTYHLIDKDECARLLTEAGFRVEHIEEYSKETYVRGNDESVTEHIESTIGDSVSGDIRAEIVANLLRRSGELFKSPRGWVKEVCRLRVIAIKE